jgi:hypothetical protein
MTLRDSDIFKIKKMYDKLEKQIKKAEAAK